MAYIPHTPQEVREMLQVIGVEEIEDLFESIPKELRFQKELDLPAPMAEWEILEKLAGFASANTALHQQISFLGAGAYDHHVPSIVDGLSFRGEFFSAYTPYQAEASQGSLQVFYEFQSLICRLVAMEVANASMYDGASALAESVIMALHLTGRKKVALSKAIHPEYLEVVRTYLSGFPGVEILEAGGDWLAPEEVEEALSEELACFAYQTPNFFGNLEDQELFVSKIQKAGALAIAVIADPLSLSMVSPPGEFGVDIVCGEAQSLGNPLSLGGPSLGFLATKKEFIRKIPGRIVGETVDKEGKRAFVLTLQTREQHIRREKATSNICTNQALLALRTTIYLSSLGKEGFFRLGNLCFQRAHALADRLASLKGFQMASDQPFFREFALECPVEARKIVQTLAQEGILPGLDLGRFDEKRKKQLLICVTEKNSPGHLDRLAAALERWSP